MIYILKTIFFPIKLETKKNIVIKFYITWSQKFKIKNIALLSSSSSAQKKKHLYTNKTKWNYVTNWLYKFAFFIFHQHDFNLFLHFKCYFFMVVIYTKNKKLWFSFHMSLRKRKYFKKFEIFLILFPQNLQF